VKNLLNLFRVARWPAVEPTTLWLQARHPTRYATTSSIQEAYWKLHLRLQGVALTRSLSVPVPYFLFPLSLPSYRVFDLDTDTLHRTHYAAFSTNSLRRRRFQPTAHCNKCRNPVDLLKSTASVVNSARRYRVWQLNSIDEVILVFCAGRRRATEREVLLIFSAAIGL